MGSFNTLDEAKNYCIARLKNSKIMNDLILSRDVRIIGPDRLTMVLEFMSGHPWPKVK